MSEGNPPVVGPVIDETKPGNHMLPPTFGDAVTGELGCDAELLAPVPVQGAVDKNAIFVAFLSTFGDVGRTADVFGISPQYVGKLAEDNNWLKKVHDLQVLKATQGAEALAKELNRVANLVQAIKLRGLLEQIIRIHTKSRRTIEDLTAVTTRDATNVTMKPVLELVKAVEAVHRMTYAALGDSPAAQRAESRDEESEPGKDRVSLAILKAIAVSRGDHTKAAQAVVVDTAQPDKSDGQEKS